MTVLKQEGNYAVIKYEGKTLFSLENKRPIPRDAHYVALNIIRSYKHNPKDFFIWIEDIQDDVRTLQQMIGGE